MRNCVCVWGRVHTLPRRLYAYNLSLPSNEGEGIIQRRHYNDVIRRNQVRWARASKRPDRTVQRHELHQTGNGMPIKRGDASSSNYTACNFSRDRWRSKIGRDGGRVTPEMTSYDSIGHRPPSLPLFFSFIFYSNESNKKQKGVGKPRIEGGIYGICIYVYIHIWWWFVCTVAVAAMIYFPVKRRIFVFPVVEMNVGQKWPRNKRPALNTHAYFIRMNYCGRLWLSSPPPSCAVTLTRNVNYHKIHVSDIIVC